MADIICAFPHGGARGGPPEREVVSFSIFLPDGAPSLQPNSKVPPPVPLLNSCFLARGRQAGKAEKATDGWIERLVQRWSYLVTRVYDFETHLN